MKSVSTYAKHPVAIETGRCTGASVPRVWKTKRRRPSSSERMISSTIQMNTLVASDGSTGGRPWTANRTSISPTRMANTMLADATRLVQKGSPAICARSADAADADDQDGEERHHRDADPERDQRGPLAAAPLLGLRRCVGGDGSQRPKCSRLPRVTESR